MPGAPPPPASPPDACARVAGPIPPRDELHVVLGALAIGLLWLFLVPPFMGPDEPWHLEYAEHVAAGHWPTGRGGYGLEELARHPLSAAQVAARFPSVEADEIDRRQRELLESLERVDWWARVDWAEDPGRPISFDLVHPGITAAHQPPAYYLLVGGLLALAPEGDPALRVRLARLPSVGALIVVGLAALALGRALAGERAGRMAAAIALAAPPAARMASTASNDALAVALVAGATWAAATLARRPSRGAWLALAGCLALAPAAKSTALAAFVLLVAPALRRAPSTRPWRAGWQASLVLGILGLALVALLLRASPVLPASFDAAGERLERGLSTVTWQPVFTSFEGTSNWDSRSPPGWPAAILELLLAGALLAPLLERVRRSAAAPAVDRRLALLMLLLVVAQAAGIALRGVGSGRYLLPAWPALAALLAAGWSRWPRSRTPPNSPTAQSDLPLAILVGLLVAWHATTLFGGVLLEERLLLGR